MTNASSARNQSGTAFQTRYIAFTGVFGAIAAVLMFLEIPLPFAPSFYQLDFSEVPVLIGTFAMGPVSGLLIELIKILVHLVVKGTHTAGVGEAASFMIGAALLIPAGIIYRRHKTRKTALIGMACGTLTMVVAGCFINAFILLPTYAKAFGMPMDALIGMGTAVNKNVHNLQTFALFCVAPFNLFKGVVVSAVTYVLYKHVSVLIHKAGQ